MKRNTPSRTGKKSSEKRSSTIAAALQPFVDAGSLAGAVALVADKDRVLSLDAVGFADIASRKPMKTDALFWIASQSKPITAAALMMLVDKGRVRLDDTVESYLPEFKNLWLAVEKDADHVLLRKPHHPITIREILSHTSGMPFASAMEQPTLDMLTLKDAVASYAITPLEFEPGSKYQYSNAGINTAGRIIEVVSGMSYEDFLDRRLFEPLGMTDTTFWPNARQTARLAKSYNVSEDKKRLKETLITQLHYPLQDRCRQPMPAGGLFSTAADVARFCQMILRGGVLGGKRYLSKSAVSEMTHRQTPAALPTSYGLGWSVDGETYGHGGAFGTNMTIYASRGLIRVFLLQHAGFPEGGDKCRDAFFKAAEELFG
jgi:CubicO group peptidase (beta-lactamase class C family)